MKRIINYALLIFSILGFAACSAFPETVIPISQEDTPTALHPLEATAIPYKTITKTPTMTIQSTQTATPTPSLFDSLPPGLYIMFRGYENIGFKTTRPLYVLSFDGKDYGQLLDTISENAGLSPDGKTIAYTVYIADHNNPSPPFYTLRLLDLETTHAQDFIIPNCPIWDDTAPAWSPDGTLLAISCGNYIAKISIASDTVTVASSLVLANILNVKEAQIDTLTWSPDGKYLSFYISHPSLAVSGPSDPFSIDYSPYLISSECPDDASTCQVTPISLGVKGTSISRWTPHNLLAVLHESGTYSEIDGIVHYDDYRFNLFDPVTKKIVRSIIMPLDLPISSFVWSPDNKWIVYATYTDGNGPTYIMPASGGESKVLSENGGDVMFWLQVK